ncbi:heat shock protein DnaJ, partial [Lentithecium fluviatile CBS 122367]
NNRDYYADLGLNSNASPDEIKSAFHRLAKQHHPDRKGPEDNGDASEFRKVREAYEKLSDPDEKAAYD